MLLIKKEKKELPCVFFLGGEKIMSFVHAFTYILFCGWNIVIYKPLIYTSMLVACFTGKRKINARQMSC